MFIGHLGVGLALKRADREVNLGVLVFAALLLDFLLGLFVLAGLEQVHVPSNYARLHYLRFTFPWSHGLLMSLVWSGTAGLAAWAWFRRMGPAEPATRAAHALRAGGIVAAAVFSHFVGDLIEHPPQLPVVGLKSPLLGLGLWDHLDLALTLEVALVVWGVAAYLGSFATVGRWERQGLIAFMAILSASAVAGQAGSSVPPALGANIAAWLGLPVLLGSLAGWFDRRLERADAARGTGSARGAGAARGGAAMGRLAAGDATGRAERTP